MKRPPELFIEPVAIVGVVLRVGTTPRWNGVRISPFFGVQSSALTRVSQEAEMKKQKSLQEMLRAVERRGILVTDHGRLLAAMELALDRYVGTAGHRLACAAAPGQCCLGRGPVLDVLNRAITLALDRPRNVALAAVPEGPGDDLAFALGADTPRAGRAVRRRGQR